MHQLFLQLYKSIKVGELVIYLESLHLGCTPPHTARTRHYPLDTALVWSTVSTCTSFLVCSWRSMVPTVPMTTRQLVGQRDRE